MTAISTATPDWLALRAPADAASRSAGLARALARLIADRAEHARLANEPAAEVVVHDLGAGTGSMTRWLAPRLPGPQRWILRDGDAEILAHLDLRTTVDASGRPIDTATLVEDLGDLPLDAFHGATAVTASALLDVVTAAEARRIVDACVSAGAPALLSLNVSGVVRVHPATHDAELEHALTAAFNDHQRRDTDGRRMLGPDAVRVVAGLFDAAGWQVRTASTPWHLGTGDARLAAEWFDGWMYAALEQRPELTALSEAYRGVRRAQATAGRLRVSVGHEDLLAWPR